MADPSYLSGDYFIRGNLQAQTLMFPVGGINDIAVNTLANIDSVKLKHRDHVTYSQPNVTETYAEAKIVFRERGLTGSVISVYCGLQHPPTGSSCDKVTTADVTVNGVSILSAPVTLDKTKTAYISYAGSIVSPVLTTGDIVSVVIVRTGSVADTDPAGVFVAIDIDQTA